MRANQLVKCAGFIAATFVVLFSGISFSFSQVGGTAAPFLLINPSAEAVGMGGSSAVLPSDDPYSFAFNPAQLGFLGKNNNIAVSFYPTKIDYLPQFHADLGFTNYTLTGGFDASGYLGIPLKIGVGFLYQYLNLGEFTKTSVNGQVLGKYTSYESAFTTSLGFCFDYLINISGGIAIKNIISDLTPTSVGQQDAGKGDAFAVDFGLLANYPIIKSHQISDNLALNFSISAGYTLANFGGKINYIVESDALPRTARIGLGISAGLDMKYDNGIIPAVKLDLVSEADDILVNHYPSGRYDYKNITGNINLWENVFLMKSSNLSSYNLHGIQLSLFDIAVFRIGESEDFNHDNQYRQTTGFTIKAKGIFQILKPLLNNDIVNYMAKHIDFGYSYANYGDSKLSGNNSIFFRFKGFEI